MATLDRFLKFAVQNGASDLHITPAREPTLRLHGTLRKLNVTQWRPQDSEAILAEILTPEQRQTFTKRLSLDFAYVVPDIGRFRVNIYKERLGVGGTFRVLPTHVPTLEELGLPPVIKKMLTYRHGLVLVTGAAGCGKTTTQGAMINFLNETRHEHIITVEDPIEIVHHNKNCTVTQREVLHHTQSFAAALRAALREDPDIILVGEMRDLETIQIAITCAETGHLVLGTLHTPGAAYAVDRMIDVFPPEQIPQIRAMVSESMRGVVYQELVPRSDGQGRVVAQEIMVCTAAIANMIRESRTFQIPSLMQIGVKLGMRLMEQSLFELVKQGLIKPEDALERVLNPTEFTEVLAQVQELARPGEDEEEEEAEDDGSD
jgi:twitching motility protein PilT